MKRVDRYKGLSIFLKTLVLSEEIAKKGVNRVDLRFLRSFYFS
jgi:hypothetical protein